jgi:erythromycin esterase
MRTIALLLLLLAACGPVRPEVVPTVTTAVVSVSPTPILVIAPTNVPAPSASSPPLLPVQSNAPEAALSWLKAAAIPFDTAEPRGPWDDLQPIKAMIGDARIVALGEATHGTHEFFTMKHRLLEFLVQDMGFTVFAMEAPSMEAELVNDNVQTGTGDPAQLLAGLKYAIWNTQEVLDMIRWMGIYNAGSQHTPKVSFYGFDMQYPQLALESVLAYLAAVDPQAADAAEQHYACYRPYAGLQQRYYQVPASERATCHASLQWVVDDLTLHEAEYTALSSTIAFAHTLYSARLVLQGEAFYSFPVDPDGLAQRIELRDRFMAENVAWIVDHAGPDAKIVLWAHNAHVRSAGVDATGADGELVTLKTMGTYLRERYGRALVTVGFGFYEGSFNAVGSSGILGPHEVQVPERDSYEAFFRTTGLPRLIIDLRNLPSAAAARNWLMGPHPFFNVGGQYTEPYTIDYPRLPQTYDVLIYFQQTSPSILLRSP